MEEESPQVESKRDIAVEYNKPFSISLPERKVRHLIKGPASVGDAINLFRANLHGKDEGEGIIEIASTLFPYGFRRGQALIFPAGQPNYKFRLDKTTGLTLAEEFPIKPYITFGPVSQEEVDSKKVGISLFYVGDEFEVIAGSVPFYQNSEPRRITTVSASGALWVDKKTGNHGPLYLPSTVDFKKIQFVIKKSS